MNCFEGFLSPISVRNIKPLKNETRKEYWNSFDWNRSTERKRPNLKFSIYCAICAILLNGIVLATDWISLSLVSSISMVNNVLFIGI